MNKSIQTIADLEFDKFNARQHTPRNLDMIEHALNEVGAARSIVVDENGRILAGNATVEAAALAGIEKVRVIEADGETIIAVRRAGLTEQQKRRLALYDNRTAELAEWDGAMLAALLSDDEAVVDGLFTGDELAYLVEDALGRGGEGEGGGDTAAQVDKAAELQAQWQVEPGQLWQLGEHRVICGDCTDKAVIDAVMGGEKASLCHADPPYGMGKDSIANDNLYGEKLDTFQMQWWRSCRQNVSDNGSVYIWGNAADLWRLWYCGGLRDSERLTFRNEIVWDKQDGENLTLRVNGKTFQGQRSHYQSERCLFFMIGEQGFNSNADNYWEGWESIRTYLENEMNRCGWTVSDLNRITGTQMGGHWVTKSQWGLITAEHYEEIQLAAREHDAFKREHDELKREHDELKREFYATRAYFDNTHDNMTDVWVFPCVKGEERWGHATPKPVGVVERIVMTSSQSGDLVLDPFLGSGTTLVACQNLNRKCRGVEIEPKYVAVTLQRFLDHTGIEPVVLS